MILRRRPNPVLGRSACLAWASATLLAAPLARAQGGGAPPQDKPSDSAEPQPPDSSAGQGAPSAEGTPAAAQAEAPPGASPDGAAPQGAPPGEAAPPPFSFSHPLDWPQAVERVAVDGYLLPQFEIVSLPSAQPSDQLVYGAKGSRAGFALHGTPFEGWSYMVHLVVTPAGTESVSILGPAPVTSGSLIASTATGTSVGVEEMSMTFRPTEWYLAKVGVIRLPFSPAQVTPIPKQMFPFRASQTEVFQAGADAGVLNTFAPFHGRVQANAGIFLGSSLVYTSTYYAVRGATFIGSLELHPFGAMPLGEGDQARGPLRLAVGAAGLYRAAEYFDPTGYEAIHQADVRVDASVRASFKGAYLQAEYLRYVGVNTPSLGRPGVNEAGYGQAAYYFPVKGVGFSPILRVGELKRNENFAPTTFTSFEGGLAFYPRSDLSEPERLRILVEYLGASLQPTNETEHEGIVQLQLEF